jgi:hypothetical protein
MLAFRPTDILTQLQFEDVDRVLFTAPLQQQLSVERRPIDAVKRPNFASISSIRADGQAGVLRCNKYLRRANGGMFSQMTCPRKRPATRREAQTVDTTSFISGQTSEHAFVMKEAAGLARISIAWNHPIGKK